MSLGGLRSIYDEIKTLRARNSQLRNPFASDSRRSSPNSSSRPPTVHLKRTQSRDRSTTNFWRETQCCCQQRVNESERVRRRIASENAELRRLCLYLDHQRQKAFHELSRLKQSRPPPAACWYSDDPCCSSNCEFRHCCPMDPTVGEPRTSDSPPQQLNDELFGYIRALEDRIASLEDQHLDSKVGTTDPWVREDDLQSDGFKLRRPIRSVSQQASPSSTSTPEFTMQPQALMHEALDSSGTFTSSGTTFGSSELDDEDEEDEDSTATTVYVAKKTAAVEAGTKRKSVVDFNEKTRTALVRKFLNTRERFLQNIKRRSELPPQPPPHATNGYSEIQRPKARIGEKSTNGMNWNGSEDLPPKLVVPRIFTVGLQPDPRSSNRRAA